MAAYPDFKWYKRPAPACTRQSKRRGRKSETGPSASSIAITPGKLADESQMGNLSRLMQISDQTKKRHLDMANYIASEHDYLETKTFFINNNSIISCEGALGQYTTDDLGTPIDVNAAETEKHNDDYGGEEELSMDTADEEDGGQGSVAIQDTLKNPPECPSFKEFMKACPTYSYDEFMDKRAETSSAHKIKLQKRRKWAEALSEYGASPQPTVSLPPRRRRKRRIAGACRPQKRPRPMMSNTREPMPEHEPSPPHTNVCELVQQATLSICPSFVPSIPNANNLDLLVTAAETLEQICL